MRKPLIACALVALCAAAAFAAEPAFTAEPAKPDLKDAQIAQLTKDVGQLRAQLGDALTVARALRAQRDQELQAAQDAELQRLLELSHPAQPAAAPKR